MPDDLTPKLCECGCGQPTSIAKMTNRAEGRVKGQPVRFVSGHNGRRVRKPRLDEHYYRIEDRGYTTPCWIWTKSLVAKGYGHVWHPTARRLVMAHRRMYEQEIGPIPDGLQLDHLCRVRACVNPAHLEPVTQEVNQRRGLNAKLTDDQRVEISRLRGDGWTLKALAQRFEVSGPAIANSIRRQQP